VFGAGEESWTSVESESSAQRWTVVHDLESAVTYEVKLIAADVNDAVADCRASSQTPVKRVDIDIKRGVMLCLPLP